MQRSQTEVEAASGALALLGQPPIADLTQATAGARAAASRFADVRDALLRAYDWNFAAAWDRPARDPQSALGPLTNRFPLPDDCLLVRGVDGLETDEWAVEAAAAQVGAEAGSRMVLATNADTVLVSYTRRVENPAQWDALFLDVFQLRLAAALAPMIGADPGKGAELANRAEAMLLPAKRRDAREKARAQVSRSTSWLDARRSGWR